MFTAFYLCITSKIIFMNLIKTDYFVLIIGFKFCLELPFFMADRLTELQDAVNLQAENLCNAIGVIQQVAQPSFFSDFNWASRSSKPEYQNFIQQQQQPTEGIFGSYYLELIFLSIKTTELIMNSLSYQ